MCVVFPLTITDVCFSLQSFVAPQISSVYFEFIATSLNWTEKTLSAMTFYKLASGGMYCFILEKQNEISSCNLVWVFSVPNQDWHLWFPSINLEAQTSSCLLVSESPSARFAVRSLRADTSKRQSEVPEFIGSTQIILWLSFIAHDF